MLYHHHFDIVLLRITPTVVGVYIQMCQGAQHQTCTFNFHYENNLTFSGIQVKSMPKLILSVSQKNESMRSVKGHFTNCPHSLIPVEETKLKNRSAINHNIAHVGT